MKTGNQYKLVRFFSCPGALQLRFLDGTFTAPATSRAYSSPLGGGTCSWITILTSCNQAAFLFPVPLSSHSFLQNRLASSMFSNIRESSRARFPGSLYLGRLFSGSLFNISLKFANSLLVNHTRDLLFLFPVKPMF